MSAFTNWQDVFRVSLLVLAVCSSLQAASLYQAQYEYDVRGFVTNITENYGAEPAKIRQLSYDKLGRMVQEKLGDFEIQYTYDTLGNRIAQHQSGEETTYRYNSRNELLEEVHPSESRYLFYDLNGSLTQAVFGAEQTAYSWDSQGRLKGASTNGVEIFAADYAGGLKRLRKTESENSKIYRHDGFTPIQQVREAGEIKEYVRADRGATAVGGVLYSDDGEHTQTYSYNGVGSTVTLSRDDGLVQSVLYDAFGRVLSAEGDVNEEYLANTKELDQSINLYFHGARYYDASIGRYISLDPARDGANHYVYAKNAPLNYVDPTGLQTVPGQDPEENPDTRGVGWAIFGARQKSDYAPWANVSTRETYLYPKQKHNLITYDLYRRKPPGGYDFPPDFSQSAFISFTEPYKAGQAIQEKYKLPWVPDFKSGPLVMLSNKLGRDIPQYFGTATRYPGSSYYLYDPTTSLKHNSVYATMETENPEGWQHLLAYFLWRAAFTRQNTVFDVSLADPGQPGVAWVDRYPGSERAFLAKIVLPLNSEGKPDVDWLYEQEFLNGAPKSANSLGFDPNYEQALRSDNPNAILEALNRYGVIPRPHSDFDLEQMTKPILGPGSGSGSEEFTPNRGLFDPLFE